MVMVDAFFLILIAGSAFMSSSILKFFLSSYRDPDALSQFLEGWVINRCYFCDPVRMVSREAALTMFPPTSVPMYINQLSCPFMHVKIGDKLYKRKLETSKNCDFWNELPRYCRYCGILFGNIHRAFLYI
jgi:hypothetical protein